MEKRMSLNAEVAALPAQTPFRPKQRRRPAPWPLKYKLLIFDIYVSLLSPRGPWSRHDVDAVPIKKVAERIRETAPDMYDWWMDTHPGARLELEEWVARIVQGQYLAMFGNDSSEHPDDWPAYKDNTQEWQEAVAWVEQRLEFGAPPEVCHD